MPNAPTGEPPHLSDSGADPNPADAIPSETAQRSDQQQSTPQITARTDGRVIRATRITAAATTAIFVANAVFAVVAWKQWNAMEDALDLNRQTFAASQRPFVYYHHVNLTESQKPNIVYLAVHQSQVVVFRPIFIRIGGPEWTGDQAREAKRALRPMSRHSEPCWVMPIGSSRCMTTAWGC